MKLEVTLWIFVLFSVMTAILWPKCRPYSLLVAAAMIVTIVGTVILAKQAEPPLAAVAISVSVPPSHHADFEQLHLEKLDKADPDGKNRISLAEIRFDQIRSELGSEPGTIRLIEARLYNDSSHFTLTDYGYYLEVQNCQQAACSTLYEQRGQAAVSVPPGQARDIVIMIHDGDTRGVPAFRIVGTSNIKLLPTNTRAYDSSSSSVIGIGVR